MTAAQAAEGANDTKYVLHRYLNAAQQALLWKLEDLPEHEIRRPLVPSGTNLLGLVKHTAAVAAEYFGFVVGRPFPSDPILAALDDAPDNADMWATADESRAAIVDLYERVWRHANDTIGALDLGAPGHVPWWGERGDTTLGTLMVHMIAEVNRHAGHADVVRELIDGGIGLRAGNGNVPDHDAEWWETYRSQLDDVAARFKQG
jgi:uncharacterized damage-inducible protein DinB